MPELPEVETIRRDLERGILNKTFQDIAIIDPRVLRQPGADFKRRLKGKSITAVERKGKALALHLSSGEYLVVQVMMTGQTIIGGKPEKHTRIAFTFSDGSTMTYNDQRVFGQLRVVKKLTEVNYFNILGPEPLTPAFTAAYITQALRKTARPIKNVLLDHTFVAGVGNIYACEILFRCRINPQRIGRLIKRNEAPLLHKHTVEVLEEAIASRGSSMRNYRDAAGKEGGFKKLIQVYAREGEVCLVCKRGIIRIIQSGRSTFYCMKCQR